jgi:hypothetical protein
LHETVYTIWDSRSEIYVNSLECVGLQSWKNENSEIKMQIKIITERRKKETKDIKII